jgi:capsular polysaccharide biosynthesis protein
MELGEYWKILWRRWWLLVSLPLVVLLISLLTYQAPPPTYQASMRFAIGIEGAEPVLAPSGEGRSDAWLASEYLADDLSEVLKGGDFAADISDIVGFPVPAGSIFATREHRIMTVTITWPDRAQVQAIAEALAAHIEDGGAKYFPQLEGVQASAILIDGPGIGPLGRSLRDKLDLPLRLLVALVAAGGLAFLWDYLDDTVRGRADAEALNLPVLGEIPRESRSRRRQG